MMIYAYIYYCGSCSQCIFSLSGLPRESIMVYVLKNIFISIWYLYRVLLCDISIYMYIVPQFGSSPPLSPSYSMPLLKATSTGFSVPYSHLYRKYISLSTLLFPLHLSSPSHQCPPLNMTCFTFLSFIVLSVWLLFSGDFALVFYL
jgi:hypothetical protein